MRFWESSEGRMHLDRAWSTYQLPYYHTTTIVLPFFHFIESSTQIQQAGIYAQLQFISYNCTLSFIDTFIKHVPNLPCIHTCHAEGINAVQTCVMAGMAYTVGYIVHGPSQLASAVQDGLSHHLSDCASCLLGNLQTAEGSDRQCVKHTL